MEKYIVDRFVEKFAVLEKESGGTIDVPRELLEGEEGDVVVCDNGIYCTDKELTEKRKALMKEKMDRLFFKNQF